MSRTTACIATIVLLASAMPALADPAVAPQSATAARQPATADVRAAWLGSPQGGGRPALAPPAAADDGASLSAAAHS
jgi:hypothetical protein